jgi:peptidoglycan/LPS O-acetylase OafA/YrhL
MPGPYLPNLNGIRAISVLIVIIGHATSMQAEFAGYKYSLWLFIPGKFGVVMFFCLSGILITHLIVREIEGSGTFDAKRFYVRRIARIWPLYFLVTIPALALNAGLAGSHLYTPLAWLDYLLLFLILPGFADRPMFVGQTWSIGVEESFYLAYPLMLRLMSRTGLVIALLIVVISPDIFHMIGRRTCGPCSEFVRVYWSPDFYACIAIGCLSYLIYNAGHDSVRRVIFSRRTQWAVLAAAVAITVTAIVKDNERYFDYRWDAIVFSLLILNAGFNKDTIFRLEARPLRFLGEISYGMYMYHVFAICITLTICRIFFKGDTFPLQNLIVDSLTLAITIGLAKLSYDYIEMPIRNFAKRRPADGEAAEMVRQSP